MSWLSKAAAARSIADIERIEAEMREAFPADADPPSEVIDAAQVLGHKRELLERLHQGGAEI